MLLAQRERVYSQGEHMVGRKNRFEGREGIEALTLADVERPWEALNRGLFHFVLEGFGEQKFVRDERRIERDAGNGFGDANHAAIFPKNGGNDASQFEAVLVIRRPGFDGCQSAGKTAQAGIVWSL